MKKWLDPIATAWVGIVTHKLRSFLTILGIVIGVGAVISLMSIGKGATADILSRIESMGSNLMTISGGSSFFGGVRGAAGSSQTLTQEDADAIAEEVDNILHVAATSSSNLQVVYEGNNTNSQVVGVPTQYQDIMGLELASGAFFTDYENQRGAKVAVIGVDVYETLFEDMENVDPIGQQVRMGGNIFRIIGVLESKEGSVMSSDSAVIIPLTTLQHMVSQTRTSRGETVVSTIYLTVADEDKTETTIEDITSLLRTRHRLEAIDDDDFRITSMQEIAETVSEAAGTMTLLLGAIAAISLLVGGIGVMNIMLVSVLERTREIGIRKALGAREHDIWIQFLIEASFLSLGGGIIGVIVGWVVAYFVEASGTMSTLVTADIVILAVSVSVGIGLFFGFYPAWNASRLNPIEALRSE